jgi:hypothetical protein
VTRPPVEVVRLSSKLAATAWPSTASRTTSAFTTAPSNASSMLLPYTGRANSLLSADRRRCPAARRPALPSQGGRQRYLAHTLDDALGVGQVGLVGRFQTPVADLGAVVKLDSFEVFVGHGGELVPQTNKLRLPLVVRWVRVIARVCPFVVLGVVPPLDFFTGCRVLTQIEYERNVSQHHVFLR